METDDLRAALESAGMTKYEASAYVALLDLGTASAIEVADACDVPQSRIYDVLRDLERQEYIETYERGSLHARANDPREVLQDLQSYAETITSAAEEIEERWERPEVGGHRVSVVKRFDTVFERTKDGIEAAENELQLVLTEDDLAALREPLRDAYERGVLIKLTIVPTRRASQTADDIDVDFKGIATEVRFCRLPTPFLVLVDRTVVFFAPEVSLRPASE